MNDAPSQSQDKFIIRLPDGMRDQLKAVADMNKRSMNAEILQALEHWLELQQRPKLSRGTVAREAEDANARLSKAIYALRVALENPDIEFIVRAEVPSRKGQADPLDAENGGGPGVRLRKGSGE
jgi:predicted transcriptional regulator